MNFIQGAWQEGSGSLFTSVNPATLQVLWQGHAACQTQVQQAVAAARAAFNTWAFTPINTRIDYLKKMQTIIAENIALIAQTISDETGKALWECILEAKSMLTKIDVSLEAYHVRTGETIKPLGNFQLHLRHRPVGVLAIFVPFNFPAHLLNTHAVPALLAGNTVVIKPSEQTPKTAELMMQLWEKTGIPNGVINLVQGASETGEALAKNADINGICFTGSYKIGKMLHAQMAGKTDKLLVLEMGGNNPLIVDNISDLDNAVLTIIQSTFISAGQRCTCTRRLIIVENETTPLLLEKLCNKVKQIRVAYPTASPSSDEPFMSGVISAAAGAHVLQQQQQLLHAGGKSLLQSIALDPHNLALLSPGLMDMTGVTASDEEIFGPVLQIFRVSTLDEAITLANQTQYGLTAAILSDDMKAYELFFNRARAGVVNWNRPTTGISGVGPFGGVGHSGNFRPTGYYAADYCAYPVTSLECALIQNPELPPGIQ